MQQFNAPQVHVITTTTPAPFSECISTQQQKKTTHIFLKKGLVFVFNNVQLCKLNSQEYAASHTPSLTYTPTRTQLAS